MNTTAINIENLKKNYYSLTAVDDISFSVQEGELFGLIGPDGAGKTTTMRILCGLLSFDAGQCSIFDFDVASQIDEIRKIIGYMPQRFSLYPDLTVNENLRFFADLFQVPKNDREKRLQRLLQLSKLNPFQKRRANDLSGGMKQKLALSCTLIHTPRIIILDEPTTGVDPVSRREFWQILHDLLKEGVTILVSTPYMDEVARTDRACFVFNGQKLAEGTPGELTELFKGQKYFLKNLPTPELLEGLDRIEGVTARRFGNGIHIYLDQNILLEDRKVAFAEAGMELSDFSRVDPDLEDSFIQLMERQS